MTQTNICVYLVRSLRFLLLVSWRIGILKYLVLAFRVPSLEVNGEDGRLVIPSHS